jgi:hypothetical protein
MVWSVGDELIVPPAAGLGLAALWLAVSVVSVRLFIGELPGSATLVLVLGI